MLIVSRRGQLMPAGLAGDRTAFPSEIRFTKGGRRQARPSTPPHPTQANVAEPKLPPGEHQSHQSAAIGPWGKDTLGPKTDLGLASAWGGQGTREPWQSELRGGVKMHLPSALLCHNEDSHSRKPFNGRGRVAGPQTVPARKPAVFQLLRHKR